MKRFAVTLAVLASTLIAACDAEPLICEEAGAVSTPPSDREPGQRPEPMEVPPQEAEESCADVGEIADSVHAHLIWAIELTDEVLVPELGECVAGGAPTVDPSTQEIASELEELREATRDLIDEIPTAQLTEATIAEAQRIELMAMWAASLSDIETCEEVETVPVWIKCAGPLGGSKWWMCDCSTTDDCKTLKKRCDGKKIGNGDLPGGKATYKCSKDESN